MASATTARTKKRRKAPVPVTIFAPYRRRSKRAVMVSTTTTKPAKVWSPLARYRRSPTEVERIVKQTEILREHGFNWLAISRVLQVDNAWLHRLKTRYKLG